MDTRHCAERQPVRPYIGASGRSYRDARYARVQTGDHSPVWYSVSHPWVSTLREPEPPSTGFSPIGVPIVLFILFVEVRAVLTVIAPTHRWAIDFNNRSIFRPRSSSQSTHEREADSEPIPKKRDFRNVAYRATGGQSASSRDR